MSCVAGLSPAFVLLVDVPHDQAHHRHDQKRHEGLQDVVADDDHEQVAKKGSPKKAL